jgi:lipopolysaccharide export system protein LptA
MCEREVQIANFEEKEKMRRVSFRSVLAFAAVALALPMMAKTDNPAKPDAKTKSATLTINAPVKFGTTMLKAGTYKLMIDSEKATIESGKTVIASASGHWEDRKQKADSTGFETTNGQVDDIFLHGDSSVFVLNSSQIGKS